jgi:rod shape-determining protein MreC
MRNIFRSRAFVLLAFTFFCLLLIVVTSNNIGDFQWVADAASAPLSPLVSALSGAARDADASVRVATGAQAIIDENAALRDRVAALEKENRDLIGYRDKMVELQNALNLKGRFADYTLVGGNVITRGVGNWFDVLKIDVGRRSGVNRDMPVVSATMALVGRTISSSSMVSKAVTLIDEECIVSGWVVSSRGSGGSDAYTGAGAGVGGGGAVVVRGDLTLKGEGLCRIDHIPDGLDIRPGDIVETSGIGGIFPRGIEIGTVLSLRQTANGLVRYAILEPFANLTKIDEVFVIVGHDSEMEAGEVAR